MGGCLVALGVVGIVLAAFMAMITWAVLRDAPTAAIMLLFFGFPSVALLALGRRRQGGSTAPPGDGAAAEWDKLIDRRLVSRRWLIVTSQETPAELARRGAILDSTASRLALMTRGAVLYFDGDDMRQEAGDA